MQRQIVLTEIGRDAERIEALQQRVFRVIGQGRDFWTAIHNPAGRPFVSRNRFPGLVHTLLAFGHGPGCVPFIEKRFAPFDELIVDLLDDMRPQRIVAPVREGEPTAQVSHVVLDNSFNPLAQISYGHHQQQLLRKAVD